MAHTSRPLLVPSDRRAPARRPAAWCLGLVAAGAGAALAHDVTSILPPAGATGQAVILQGSGFAAGGRKPKVYATPAAFGAKRPPRIVFKVTDFDDDSIDAVVGKLGKRTPPGTYDLHVDVRGQPAVVLQGGFVVPGIELVSVHPQDARPGDEITITATGNGTQKGKVAVQDPRTGRSVSLRVSEWIPGTIRAKLPKRLPDGDYSVSLRNTISSDVLTQAIAVGEVLGTEHMTFSSDVFPDYEASDGFPQARVVESASSVSQVLVAGQYHGANPVETRMVGLTLFFTGSLDDLTLPRTFVVSPTGTPGDGVLVATISSLVTPPAALPIANVWSSEIGDTFTVTLTRVEQAAVEGTFEGSLTGDDENTLPGQITTTAGRFRAPIMSRQTAP